MARQSPVSKDAGRSAKILRQQALNIRVKRKISTEYRLSYVQFEFVLAAEAEIYSHREDRFERKRIFRADGYAPQAPYAGSVRYSFFHRSDRAGFAADIAAVAIFGTTQRYAYPAS